MLGTTKFTEDQIQERLARWGSSPDFRAALEDDLIKHPYRVCRVCGGSGIRRGTNECKACRNVGSIEMTEDEIRDSYRVIRRLACLRFETTSAIFDSLVEGHIRASDLTREPGVWLFVARRILEIGKRMR